MQSARATHVYASASHGVVIPQANQALAEPALEKVIVTNTIPPFRLAPELIHDKLKVLDVALLVAAAIGCLHTGSSIVELNERG